MADEDDEEGSLHDLVHHIRKVSAMQFPTTPSRSALLYKRRASKLYILSS